MASSKPRKKSKKYFTVDEANATLPLVRVVVRDIMNLANELRDRNDRLTRLEPEKNGHRTEAHAEELVHAQADFERGQERMQEYETELRQLGIELKDYFTGLIDYPCWMDGHEVYLCWKFDEPEVAHWHEIDAGFSGRRPLKADAVTRR